MPEITTAILAFVFSLGITLFVLPRFAHIASELGLVDLPGRRKVHKHPKPLVGGLAMSLGVAFSCLLLVPLNFIKGYPGGSMRGYYAGAMLLVVIGFFDDFREVNHRLKFLAQIIAALLVAEFSRVTLSGFGDLLHFGSIDLPGISVPMTILGMVGVINAFNMIDGLDGLAGGVAFVSFAVFAVLSSLDGHVTSLLLCLALCGSLIPFLRYNWHPARLFMGDAGSLFLGFSAAFVSIVLTQEQHSMVRPIEPLLVLAVPITDTITVMTRRIMRGKSPFFADKTHLHHVLLKFGLTKQQTTLVILGISAAFGLLAIAGAVYQIPEYELFSVFLAYFFVCFTGSFLVKKALLSHRSKNREVKV